MTKYHKIAISLAVALPALVAILLKAPKAVTTSRSGNAAGYGDGIRDSNETDAHHEQRDNKKRPPSLDQLTSLLRESPQEALKELERLADSNPGADYVQQFAFIIATSQADLAIRSKALGFVSGDRLEAASVGLLADLARDGQRENALRLLASLPDAVAGKAASAFGASLVINRHEDALDLAERFGQGDIRADETVRGIARGMTMLEGAADEYRARLAEVLWEHGKNDRLIGSVVVPAIYEKELAEGGSARAVAVISTQISALPESVRRDLWMVLIQSTSDDPHEVSELINGSRLGGNAGSEMLQQAVEMIISNGNNIEGGIKFTSWLTDTRDRKLSAFQAGSLCAPRIDSVEEAKNFMRLLGEDQVGSFIDGLTKQKKFRSGAPIEPEELR